jgi:peptidoglycan/LPS O-acetylase OafA/YrhL
MGVSGNEGCNTGEAVSLNYRAEIDGLRAVAVVPVILAHAGATWLHGGFLGVDVFFVISGFLITGIIAQETQKGEFSFAGFYERRVRRILPALYLVIAASAVAAFVLLYPNELRNFAESVVATALFSSNIYFNGKISYFTPNVETYPLIHTWSLGVEEQYYVLAPLCLAFALRFGRKVALGVVAVFSLASLIAAQYMSGVDPQANFYLLPFRAWELGLGGMLALASAHFGAYSKKFRQGAALLGGVLLVTSYVALGQAFNMPNVWALAPTGGAALVIAFARGDTIVGRLLSSRLFIFIGAISYSAYLWHQPLFAFARVKADGAPPFLVMAALTLLTFALAWASWRFVERPFRNRNFHSRRWIFAGALACGVALIVTGRVTVLQNGFPSRSAEFAAIANWQDRHISIAAARCQSDMWKIAVNENSCVFPAGRAPTIALLGDSHADVLAESLGDAVAPFSQGVKELAHGGCPPVRGLVFNDAKRRMCPEFIDSALRYLDDHNELATLVVFARWPVPFESDFVDNEEGGAAGVPGQGLALLETAARFADPNARYEALGKLFRDQINAHLQSGRRVVLVYSVPETGWNVPRRVIHNQVQRNIFGAPPLSVSHDVYVQRTRNVHAQLDLIGDHPNLVRVKPEEIFCNRAISGRCVVENDGAPLYFDDNHLNRIGNSLLSQQIVAAMKSKGWL